MNFKQFYYWIPAYVIAITIFYFSSLPSPLKRVGRGASGWMLHVFEYGLLSIAVYFAFRNSKDISHIGMKTFAFVFLFAIIDEIHQLFVPGRVASISDVGIDAVGSFLVLMFRSA